MGYINMNSENIEDLYVRMVIKIQKWFRGVISRLKILPLILYKIQNFLRLQNFNLSIEMKDGRINSCVDEKLIITLLVKKFKERIKQPKIRMWYDVMVFDYLYGWIPINIKTTSTKTNDNVGNLAMCVQAYTNEKLDLRKSYHNGNLSDVLYKKLQNKAYNTCHKKDYYFVVVNKKDTKDIIVNSVKGLTTIKSNNNNLPFQVCWNKNRKFKYDHITKKVQLFVECMHQTKQSWRENFISNMHTLNL